MRWIALSGALIPFMFQGGGGMDQLTLKGSAAQVSVAMDGGGLVEFRMSDQPTNPLNWELAAELEPRTKGTPYLRGHFLCFDRWGAPTEAEIRNGIPFHGEAPRIAWRVERAPESKGGLVTADMACDLPVAGFKVTRQIRLVESQALVAITERATNSNKTGRVYNMVQHPTIAPPFLAATTEVDSNARQGFVQEAGPPKSPQSAATWPNVVVSGRAIDLRYLKDPGGDSTASDVSSFVFDNADEYGWVTAASPASRLLIGYVWRTREYPWLNIWRQVLKGRIAARGLEFGTTGYHQTYPVLVRTGRVLDRPLFEYLDTGETVQKSYGMFLLRIPADFRGVARVALEPGRLVVTERGSPARTLSLETGAFSLD